MEKHMDKTILKLRNNSVKEVLAAIKIDKFPAIMEDLLMLQNEAIRLTEIVDEYLKGVEDGTKGSN